MKMVRMPVFAVAVAAMTGLLVMPEAAQLTPTAGTRLLISQTSDDATSDQRAMIAFVERMIADGDLRLIDRRQDGFVEGSIHERFRQVFAGVPVFGADVAVQRRNGQVLSMFGVVYEGLRINVTARRPTAEIANVVRANGFAVTTAGDAQLFVLPAPDGSVSVAYLLRDDSGKAAYVDANSGTIVLQLNEFQTQAAVGQGTGVLGDSKKVSATGQSGSFVSSDGLRPPALETYDLRGDGSRVMTLAVGRGTLSDADLARSSNNVWTDGAVVDAHVYAGWVYDYYFKRFQRRGLDDNNIRIQSIVNPMRATDYFTAPPALRGLFINAFYSTGCRCVVYGPGVPAGVVAAFPQGVRNFAGALDVVAHELTHAVTDASSRLAYLNESGALNEAFSDMMGTSVEFFHQPTGTGPRTADYLMGEDLTPVNGSLQRSMRNPDEFDQPSHYWFRSYIGALLDFDSGGVHTNSGIANNAFYLAIEGGTHPSGQVVIGVGAQNREQIERIFYRAFTAMLPASATFFQARQATVQAARDLFGAASAPERAVIGAWTAVGVTSTGSALTTQFSPPRVTPSNARCSGSTVTPSFTFRVAVTEFQRVGFTVERFVIDSYDASLRLISRQDLPPGTFRSLFNECQAGNTRVGAGSTACTTLCATLGGRTSGAAIFWFGGTDDNGNYGLFNSDLVRFGTTSFAEFADGGSDDITYSRTVRQ